MMSSNLPPVLGHHLLSLSIKRTEAPECALTIYRKLNAVTRKDAYPLPRIDDALNALSGSKWFSTLDLISGYWQVEKGKTDQEKSAFCTSEGLFEFKVRPFGLCNAPATFERLMDLVLAGLQWSTRLVYLDYLIIVIVG